MNLLEFPAKPLDRKTLTTAYPQLTVSGGKGAKIVLTYAEALYDKDQHKGDRDEVADRKALGLTDSFPPRRRRAPHLRAALVAHLALSRPRHHYRRRPAHPRIPHRPIHRLSL
jgi:hypothetical protein